MVDVCAVLDRCLETIDVCIWHMFVFMSEVYVNGILQNGLESGNNKPFWKYVKSPKQETFGISALKSSCNMITDSLAEMLNSQLEFFLLSILEIHFPSCRVLNVPNLKFLHISDKLCFHVTRQY